MYVSCPAPGADPNSHSLHSRQFLQMTYTLDFLDKHDFYHEDIIRSKLIRNLPAVLKDVNEEIALALDDNIPAVGEGVWYAHVKKNAQSSRRT